MARTADRKAESPYAGAPAIALPARVGDAGTNVFFFSLIHTQTRTHSHHARHATAVAGFSLGNTGVFT